MLRYTWLVDRSSRHQSRDTLAADASALGGKLGVNAWHAVSAARGRMRGTDLRHQCAIRRRPPRRKPLHPCMVAAGGDTQQPTHGGDRIGGLVIAHEAEPFAGIAFVSRANQAAAFERISRSNRSWRFSRRSRWSSSRSAVVRPPSPRPALRADCATQFRIDCAVGSNPPQAAPVSGRRAPVPPSGGGTRVRRVIASWPSGSP